MGHPRYGWIFMYGPLPPTPPRFTETRCFVRDATCSRTATAGAAQRTFPALFAFAKGGTLTETTAGVSPALSTPGYGVWRHTDGHSYSAVVESFVFNPAGA